MADGVIPTANEIELKASKAAFGRALITNVHRGLVAEAIVASALEPEWRWCSEDYAGWDFERSDGLRLEVKQSAAKQSWTTTSGAPSYCSFDIAKRTGRWENGIDWIGEPGRNAHLYVFAHHPVFDETADHRDPRQWRFYVVASSKLPDTKRIGIAAVRSLSDECEIGNLGQRVAGIARVASAGLRPFNR